MNDTHAVHQKARRIIIYDPKCTDDPAFGVDYALAAALKEHDVLKCSVDYNLIAEQLRLEYKTLLLQK